MSKKKKKVLCSITGIVAMLFVVLIAFGYPNLVISLRDHRMKDQESHYTSTPIKIVQDKVGFFDRVSIADDLIWNNSYTEVFGYVDSKFEMDQDTALEKCIEHYYELFRSCCTDNNQDIVSLDDFKRSIDEKNIRIEPVLFMDTTNDNMFYAWYCTLFFNNSTYVQIYIDDETGKLLGFSGNESTIEDLDIDNFAHNLADHYGFKYKEYVEKNGETFSEIEIIMDSADGEITFSLCYEYFMNYSERYILFNGLSESEIDDRLRDR